MSNRTRIVCLHEGAKGRSIDGVFINRLLRKLDPPWIRPWNGSNVVRPVPCGGRNELVKRMPGELRTCFSVGSQTTLMVWADLDHDMENGDQLKQVFWHEAKNQGIKQEAFDQVVFVFAKDRLENWVEFLTEGSTDESREGPRVKHIRDAATAADMLAEKCRMSTGEPLPRSLEWSCGNWRELVNRLLDA